MRRWKVSLLLVVLAAMSLAQTSSSVSGGAEVIRRVGGRLACLCGSCNNTVADCPMLHCHYGEPAKERIVQMATAGYSDQQIIQTFVEQYGNRALAAPPAEGFNLLGWVMPFAALAFGLGIVWLVMKRYHQKPAPAAGPAMDSGTFLRYKQRIDQDLERLE